jgi:hypothetical protein
MTATEYELDTDIPALRIEDFDRQPTAHARLIATRARLDAHLASRS